MSAVAHAPFVALSALWLVLTGTLCNLRCTHCLNASGPDEPWLAPLDDAAARRAIAEAERLGVREIYLTGGEPFLHREILPLLERCLAVAATTVLTNGTVMTEALANALAALARASRWSLEIRVSLDAADAEANDRVRGAGTWQRAVKTIQALDARGLLPIVTATDITIESVEIALGQSPARGRGAAHRKHRQDLHAWLRDAQATQQRAKALVERRCNARRRGPSPPTASTRARSWPGCRRRGSRTMISARHCDRRRFITRRA
jgi:Radical SAM superfamily/4Fe-4S single cluster domain